MDENNKTCMTHNGKYTICKVCGCAVVTSRRKSSISDEDSIGSNVSDSADGIDLSRVSPQKGTYILSLDDSVVDNVGRTISSSSDESRDRIYSSDDSSIDSMGFCEMCGSFRETILTKMPEIVKRSIIKNSPDAPEGDTLKSRLEFIKNKKNNKGSTSPLMKKQNSHTD